MVRRRDGSMGAAALLVAALLVSAYRATGAQPPPPPPPPPQTAQPPPSQPPAPPAPVVAPAPADSPLIFETEAGAVFTSVRPPKVTEFEQALARLDEAIASATDSTLRAQLEGWTIFRAVEPGPGGAVLYVSMLDPVAGGADYRIAEILSAVLPDEAGQWRAALSSTVLAAQSVVNLHRLWTVAARPPDPPSVPDASEAGSPPRGGERRLIGDAGLIVHQIRAEKVAEFEAVLERIRTRLESTTSPTGWRAFRGEEPGPGGSVLYYLVLDPIRKGADYSIGRMLFAAAPEDPELLRAYRETYAAGQTYLSLVRVTSSSARIRSSMPLPSIPLPFRVLGSSASKRSARSPPRAAATRRS